MVEKTRLDRVYAQLLRNHPYGWALYKKTTTRDLHPGSCGYFDTDGDWKSLADLTRPDELIRSGWAVPEDPINRHGSSESLVWGPKNSRSVRSHCLGVTAGTTYVFTPPPTPTSQLCCGDSPHTPMTYIQRGIANI
jgi:hypothetical protein